MASEPRTGDAKMDVANLYREEIFTDRKVGTLRVLNPVTAAGAADAAPPTIDQGEAQLMTSMGPLPISFEIDAAYSADGVDGYCEAAMVGFERAMQELQQMRREAQSSIVIPETGALPPQGKIQLR
jgi:hypothetical protein